MGARVTEGLARHVSRAGAALAGQLRPYNQHLSTDVGATFLAIGALLLIAAWLLDHRTVVIALAVYLVYAVPHTVFHLLNDDVLTAGERFLDGIVLTVTVLGSLGLIWVSGRISGSAHISVP